MATSIQTIGENREAFNDLDLLVVVGLVIEVLTTRGQDHRLDGVRRDWERARSQYAPGIIDLNLGDISLDEGKSEALLETLSLIETDLLKQGEVIAATTLNDAHPVPGVRFSNYKTSTLLSAVRRLSTLLKGGK